MTDINKRIRKLQREMFFQKLKENYWVLLIALSLIASYTAYNIPGESRHMSALVIHVTYPESEEEHVGIANVELTDEHQVSVDVPNKAKHLKVGDHVELQENTTFFLEVKSYRYVKAIE